MATENTTIHYEKVLKSVEFLDKWNKGKKAPELAMVLGSGLSQVIPNYSQMNSVKFNEISGFKTTNVPGHSGELRIGEISGISHDGQTKTRELAFLLGRNHAYEGNSPAEVVHNIRTLIHWGVKGIILTNAAGCLNQNWELGKMMLISDQINMTGLTPLFGEFGEVFGPRFVDMTEAYDSTWQNQFQATAARMKETLYSGIYYGVLGPQYETPAEIRMMQHLGAGSVGMSTVLETIAARQMGARVAGLSCLTNYGAGMEKKPLAHDDVMAMGKKFAANIANIALNTMVDLSIA